MNQNTAAVSLKSFALTALFCIFALGATTAAYSQGTPPPNPADNNYASAGQLFLSQLQTAFLQPNPPKNPAGFPLDLYVGDINGTNGVQEASDNAALFADENMIRALYWGAQVFPAQFTPLLTRAIGSTTLTSPTIGQLAWYNSACAASEGDFTAAGYPGFGTTRNATCFFDDNSQLGGTLMDVYLHALPTQDVYNDSSEALSYVFAGAAQDPNGGVPQSPVNLGMGDFYMNPVVQISEAEVEYGTAFNIPSDVQIGVNYFNEVNNPALGLINNAGLFIGGTTYDGGGVWTPNNVGPLAGESVNVTLLALRLYQSTGNSTYLQYAENLTGLIANKWVASDGGVSQDAVNGGFAVVDVLCQMYEVDHNVTWFNDAQSVINFLLTENRDTGGYFSNGTSTTASDWNQIRLGMTASTDTTLLTQSAAAAAILEFAYVDLYDPPTPGSIDLRTSVALTTTNTGSYSETLTVTNAGTAVAPTVIVNSATLGAAATATTLPALLGDLEPGASGSITLTFPASTGANNAPSVESVAGAYTGGTFGATLRTTLP